MAKVVGIDLGTTNSVVAVMEETLRSAAGRPGLPVHQAVADVDQLLEPESGIQALATRIVGRQSA